MNRIEITNTLYTENRKKLLSKLKPKSVAVLNSNDIMPTNADGTMRFKQNSDLLYLTGIEQEETILILRTDPPEGKDKEILFIRDVNEMLLTWEGSKLDGAEATKISGIRTVMPVSAFERTFASVMIDAENVYLNTNEHSRLSSVVETRDDRFIKKCKAEYPLHNYLRIAPIIYDLRTIKSQTEIDLLQKACDLTGQGFKRSLRFIKPGVMEYEIEAEYAHEFIKSGSTFADYRPIIASGINACALHYDKNNKQCKDGEIVLMDTAAGYGNYNADMTRCAPVNGKFTKRQRAVYNSVLNVFNETRKLMVKGKNLEAIQKDAEALIEQELIKLKLLKRSDTKDAEKKRSIVKRYYPHGAAHFIGLDVHDVGNTNAILQPGMVLTCEPGIYIKEEGFGIRLENNIVVTKKGNFDLMASIPIEADEIEELMNTK